MQLTTCTSKLATYLGCIQNAVAESDYTVMTWLMSSKFLNFPAHTRLTLLLYESRQCK